MVAVNNNKVNNNYKKQQAKKPEAKAKDDPAKAAAKAAAKAKEKEQLAALENQSGISKEEGKKIIGEVSKEFGVEAGALGTKKVWKEMAGTNENITFEGDTLTINSKSLGQVKIAVGGDGEINGNDDRVLSVGGTAAGDNMTNGLNEINGKDAPKDAADAEPVEETAEAKKTDKADAKKEAKADKAQAKTPTAKAEKPQAAKTAPVEKAEQPQLNFSAEDLQNILAALFSNSISNIDQQAADRGAAKYDPLEYLKIAI